MNAVEIIEDVIGNIQNCAAGEYDVAALGSVLAELAALSAKPEPAKLPEVDEWIGLNTLPKPSVRGADISVVQVVDIRTYLHRLTAEHAAELASCNRAAQLLSDQMDAMRVAHAAELAEFKQHTANWEESAAQFSRNADFYRGLLAECARYLGPDVFICDDGSVSQDPLMLKIPELVATLKEQSRREALAYDPPIPDEIKDTSWKAEWFWAGVRAMKQQTEEAK